MSVPDTQLQTVFSHVETHFPGAPEGCRFAAAGPNNVRLGKDCLCQATKDLPDETLIPATSAAPWPFCRRQNPQNNPKGQRETSISKDFILFSILTDITFQFHAKASSVQVMSAMIMFDNVTHFMINDRFSLPIHLQYNFVSHSHAFASA